MSSATCRLCLQDVQFPARWLLFPICGHAVCESCANGSLAACPTCHASTLGHPLLRIIGVQVNDVPRQAEDSQLLKDKLRLLKALEESQVQQRKLQLELADARVTVQILRMDILLHEKRKLQEAARETATQDGGMPPGAANTEQCSTTVAVQRGLINWDEARRLWEGLKDEVIVLTPTLQDLQRPFLYFSLFVLYAMAVFLCVVMYALLDFRCASSCPGSWSIRGK